jgi:5'-AMP-activated protein kinase regulatory gamma subunit
MYVERLTYGQPPAVVVLHPIASLYEAASRMLQERLRRIPLVDQDPNTQQDLVVSVLTQYRVLRFLAVNVS